MGSRVAGSAAVGGSESGDDKEEARLHAVSISQQFEWTGLDRDKKRKLTTEPWIPDLVLWNILGYTVDENNYLNPILVCKRWNKFVQGLEPPLMFKISLLLKRGGIVEARHLHLLSDVYESLQDRSSPLYRFSSASEDGWPHIQPQFNVILMRFTCAVCTQRSPFNLSQDLYEVTCTFFDSAAARVAESVWNIMLKVQQQSWHRDLLRMLDQLLQLWVEWQGCVSTVSNIAGYLDRYYVRHHSLQNLHGSANTSLARNLLRPLMDKAREPPAPLSFLRQLSYVDELNPEERSLLLAASRACEELSRFATETWWPTVSNPTPPALTAITEAYETVLATFAKTLQLAKNEEAEMKENQAFIKSSKGKDVYFTIVTPDKTVFRLPLTSHFLASSGFLQNLNLQAGDVVKLNAKACVLEKAIEFCNMDEVDPMPEMETPLRSNDLREIVGESYASFADSMDQILLFETITFANLMNLPQLLNLCCGKTAAMIKDRSAEEIRRMFNIPNDFSPEEEAQIQEENRWVEEA